MKAFYLGVPPSLRYVPGDPLLERDRLATLSLQPLDAPPAPPAKGDDLPALTDVLTFLKFTPQETKNLVEAVQSTVKIVGGIVSIVGAVTSVVDLMSKLGVFGPKEDATQVALQQIGTRLNQIYNYLAEQEIKGLHLQAVGWRGAQSGAHNALNNAQVSPTIDDLNALVARAGQLDDALNQMLSPENGNIAFLRKVYNYAPEQFHWIDAASPPFMSRTDGHEPFNFADPAQELQARIWDPGHYIDVLFSALLERMLVTVTIEPAFRSTGYDRTQLKLLVDQLTVFINAWRGALLVASPAAGLNGGLPMPFGEPALPIPGAGILQNPYRPQAHNLGSESAPPGIVVGAVDPVMGTTIWEPFYDGFDMVGTVRLTDLGIVQEAWGGGYDYIQAKDPTKALATATQRQAQDLDQVIMASGIGELIKLRAQIQLAALGVQGSDFVQLPNAHFRLVKEGIRFDGSPIFAIHNGGVENIDLGGLAPFAQDPAKKFQGTRYFQECEKTFSFRMAVCTRMTRIQLGYRLRIGNTDIQLIPFSNNGFQGTPAPPFPTETITVEIHETTQVYNVRQSHVFSFAEEDLFEAGQPIPISQWAVPGWKGRLFMDERAGKIALSVEVRFEHDTSGEQYSGQAFVKIRNLNPEAFPDGAIVPVWVYETHIGDDKHPQEVLADSMTIHIAPSFLVMGADYFAAYWETVERLGKTVKHLSDRFARHARTPARPNPDPAWAVRRQVLDTIAMVDVVNAFRDTEPSAVAEVIQQFRPPAMRG
jgi:hypothetical protein